MSTPAWLHSPLMKAARREPVERTPVWLMRQAGRYLPEYRKLRQTTPFLDLCKNPDLAAEIMLETVERLGVDAAILFSDLLLILEPMGIKLEYSAGEGPVLHNPIRTAADVDRLLELESVEPLEFRDGDGAQDPGGLGRVAAADRFRRGPVHAGRLRRSRADRAATIGLPRP